MLPCSLTRWCNWHRGCGWGQMSSQVCGHKVGLVSQAWPDLLPPTWPRYWRFETEEEPWLFLPSPGTDAHHKEVNPNCWDCVILTGPQLNFLFFDCVKRSDGTWVTEPLWEPPPMFGQISEVIFLENKFFVFWAGKKTFWAPKTFTGLTSETQQFMGLTGIIRDAFQKKLPRRRHWSILIYPPPP